MFRMALDVSQSSAEETVYVDDRLMFVQVAASLNIGGIHHTDYDTTRLALGRLGLEAG
jgi:putative hydrolase of the HAD superfamily